MSHYVPLIGHAGRSLIGQYNYLQHTHRANVESVDYVRCFGRNTTRPPHRVMQLDLLLYTLTVCKLTRYHYKISKVESIERLII